MEEIYTWGFKWKSLTMTTKFHMGLWTWFVNVFFFLANNDIYRERKKIRYRIVQVNIYNLAFQTAIKITLWLKITYIFISWKTFKGLQRAFLWDMTKSKGKDPLEGLGGPMTRARAMKTKEALQKVLSILFEYKPKFQGEKSKVVSCIMALSLP